MSGDGQGPGVRPDPPEPGAAGPSVTGSSAAEPSATGSSVTGPSITGPSITGPSIDRPSIDGPARRRLGAEVWIVLGLSLGQSAVYSVISLTAKLTAGPPLAEQEATLNASRSVREYVDLAYQLAGIVFTLIPVALALWLLSEGGRSAIRTIGLDRRKPLTDLAVGAGLAALIGLPGLALYVIGNEVGITATIIPAALNAHWWTVPVLVLQALKNAVLEEVIAVGYLTERLERLGWDRIRVTAASAVLRGSYHLYQGFGPFIGNAVMGVIFAEYYRRKRRVMPLVIAHTVLDVVAFVGYELLGSALGLK